MGLVVGEVVGHAGDAAVDVAAAELLGRHLLARRRLHERRAAEEDGAVFGDDDRLVGHRRDVGAAGGARAEDDGDLRDAGGRHVRLVEEDAAEVVAVGEDFGLARQVGAATVDEVEARQPVLRRHLLRAQVLLRRDRVVRPALDRRVVRDDHHRPAVHRADAGDDAARRDHLVAVQLVARERRELEEGRPRVDDLLDPLARQHLAARPVQRARLLAAAAVHGLGERPHPLGLLGHPRGVRREGRRAGVDAAVERVLGEQAAAARGERDARIAQA